MLRFHTHFVILLSPTEFKAPTCTKTAIIYDPKRTRRTLLFSRFYCTSVFRAIVCAFPGELVQRHLDKYIRLLKCAQKYALRLKYTVAWGQISHFAAHTHTHEYRILNFHTDGVVFVVLNNKW